MAETRPQPILRYLRQVLGAPVPGGVTDAELLRRFVHQRDEAAFELLLWRHAAMVLHVCRNVLRDSAKAEDAFQATFLVFVRRAAAIRRAEQVGGWLYRVAYHTALKAREQFATRQRAERQAARNDTAAPVTEDAEQRELRRLICEEVNRLPARYRTPIVACFFEGKTHEEAADQLGWPRGTVASRLARARELLRRRLVRRGITLTAGSLATALPAPSSQAALAALIHTTLQTRHLFVAGALASPRIAALTEGVLHAMNWTKIKIGTIVVLLLCLGGAGATLWGARSDPVTEPEKTALRAGNEKADDKLEATDEAQQARDRAQSRLNLRKLALAMHAYAENHGGKLPPPAIYSRDGKALLSWRVALLPYLDQSELYKQFHLDEPWDSEHNKKLSETVVKVYTPVGKSATPRFKTYYQVFVSPAPARRGQPGGAGGPGGGGSGGAAGAAGGGGPPASASGDPVVEDIGITAVFVKGVTSRFPAHIVDGTSNTILIAEAGNPVPWTKPEDLPFSPKDPLPELGGLFPDVIQVALADGAIAVLTKRYDENAMRGAITANGGEVVDFDKIEILRLYVDAFENDASQNPGEGIPALSNLQRKNETLRREVDRARERLRLLRFERAAQREFEKNGERKPDPRLEQLKRDNARLQEELDKINAESQALLKEISGRQKPVLKKELPSKSK
jgi:RNA polymerase sigma factor (sigma-70 family)